MSNVCIPIVREERSPPTAIFKATIKKQRYEKTKTKQQMKETKSRKSKARSEGK